MRTASIEARCFSFQFDKNLLPIRPESLISFAGWIHPGWSLVRDRIAWHPLIRVYIARRWHLAGMFLDRPVWIRPIWIRPIWIVALRPNTGRSLAPDRAAGPGEAGRGRERRFQAQVSPCSFFGIRYLRGYQICAALHCSYRVAEGCRYPWIQLRSPGLLGIGLKAWGSPGVIMA